MNARPLDVCITLVIIRDGYLRTSGSRVMLFVCSLESEASARGRFLIHYSHYSTILISIGATTGVLYREIVC